MTHIPRVAITGRALTPPTCGPVPAGLLLATLLSLSLVGAQDSQRRFALESAAGLRLHNVTAEPATLQGKKGIRVTISEAALREFTNKTREEREKLAMTGGPAEQLAVIEGVEFDNGVIEAEIAGAPMPGAPAGARGFVGLAFRLQNDLRTYDAFYLRPTNGRADDQVRRNHSAQYISHPDWPWFRLRKEAPERYESYVDLVPGEWTKVRIEVRGAQARLFVHDQAQPTLIVHDLKSGANGKGAVALWLDIGTEAHFRALTVMRGPQGLMDDGAARGHARATHHGHTGVTMSQPAEGRPPRGHAGVVQDQGPTTNGSAWRGVIMAELVGPAPVRFRSRACGSGTRPFAAGQGRWPTGRLPFTLTTYPSVN